MDTVAKQELTSVLLVCAALAACREAGPRCDGEWCGTAVVVHPADADALLPPLTQTDIGQAVTDLIFLKLADLGLGLNTVGDSGFIPRLARSWRFENPLTIAFDLDPRARWQDGVPVTAADVAFTFDLYRDSLVNAPARPLLAGIASVTARDEHTAVFRFRHSYPEEFFDATNQMRIMPRHLLDTIPRARLASHPLVRRPIGNGPYRLVAWNAGQSIDLTADTTFFLGRPGLARIVFRITPDPGIAVTQLVADEADILSFIPGPENIARAAKAPQLRLVDYRGTGYGFLSFNLWDPDQLSRPHPLFGERELRRALFQAVDRAGLVQAVLGPYGRLPVGPISRLTPVGNDSMVPQLSFDTAAARRTLDRLGWRDADGDGIRERNGRKLEFELVVPTTSIPRRRAAVILQAQLKRLGVAVQINELELNLMTSRTDTRKYHAAFIVWIDDPTPSAIQQTWTTAGVGHSNYGGYSNPRFDRLVAEAVATWDPAAARAKWREALAVINDDAPGIWLFTTSQVAGIHRRYDNVTIRPDQWAATLWTWRVPPDRLLERDRVGAASLPAPAP